MALKIRWTPEAEDNFESIINYLVHEWTEKEIRKFAQKTQKIILQSLVVCFSLLDFTPSAIR
jgi:plasmid stabilization system protein ParE